MANERLNEVENEMRSKLPGMRVIQNQCGVIMKWPCSVGQPCWVVMSFPAIAGCD